MATNIKTIIIFFLLSFGVYAQGQIWWIDTTAAGTEKRVYLGDYNKGYTAGGINMGRLPIQISGMPSSFGYSTTISDAAVDTLSRMLDSLAQIGVQAGYGTSNSLFDSLTSTITPFAQRWSASILVTDTCQVSTSASFPAYERIPVYPDVPLTVGGYGSNKTNLYIRRYNVSGETGNPGYSIYIFGW